MSEILLNKFSDIFKNNILPLTAKGVDIGNKIFGAAILNKNDYSLIVAETNNETENPIWHGEIHTLKKFYELDSKIRPSEKNCIFLSSHEPCSLCLSAITFSGFNNFYYLFPYESTANKFNIPHDLNILKEIFNINQGHYNKNNNYWKSYSIIEKINELGDEEKDELLLKIDKIKQLYRDLSTNYQTTKISNNIPLK